jgi:predicted Zn-dependent protease
MWTGRVRLPILSSACLFVFVVFVRSGVQAQQSCIVAPALKIRTAPSIFSVEQERILGDVEAELVEGNYPVVHNEELAAHLNTVAARILSLFPPHQRQIRIILIDTPEPESFSVAPERIYVTRRMITLLKNDDELAGLLGHEVGHILTHQNAIIVSQLFHEILGVKGVSDRKDISEKFARLFDSIDRNRKMLRKAAQVVNKQEGVHQYEADRIALYASAAAGFSPQAFVDLFKRSADKWKRGKSDD